MPLVGYKALSVFMLAWSACFAAGSASASQADLDREVDQIVSDFQAKSQAINLIVKRIKWTGIADTRLFDVIETELLGMYLKDSSFDGIQYSSWLVQALAFSGQDKYVPTLQKVLASTPSQKLKRHTESSLKVLPDFARWNPVIHARLDQVPAEQVARQRVVNMLQAEDAELARAGASFAYDAYLGDPQMTDLVKEQTLARYRAAPDDPEVAEAVAWMCKVLGQSGRREYIGVLQEVKTNSTQSAVQRWAGKALLNLQRQSGIPERGKR